MSVLASFEAGNLYQRRLARGRDVQQNRGLMSLQVFSEEDEQCILGIAALLSQMEGNFIIRHPSYNVRLKMQKRLGARLIFLLTMGDYAQRLCEAVLAYVKEGSQVMTLGAGVGLVSLLAFERSKKQVVVVEADPALQEILEANALLNRADFNVQWGCVVAGQNAGLTDYYVAEDLWCSSVYLEKGEGYQHIQVPVLNLDQLIKTNCVNTLVIDIQGAELGLFEGVDLSAIETLILTVHTELIGETATAKLVAYLGEKGFKLQDLKGWVFVFKR